MTTKQKAQSGKQQGQAGKELGQLAQQSGQAGKLSGKPLIKLLIKSGKQKGKAAKPSAKPSARKQAPRRKQRGMATAGRKMKQSGAATLAVTGEGEVRVRPDLAILNLSVITTSQTAQEAVRMNAQRMEAVLAAIKLLGISPTDIQTVGYNVVPVIDYEERSPTFGKIREHQVESVLQVRVDIERTGQTIDASIAAGANMASRLRFGLRDEMGTRARALRAAVRAARRDADVVSDAIDVNLRRPETVEINMSGSAFITRELMAAKAVDTPIEAGTITVSASVRVVYRIT